MKLSFCCACKATEGLEFHHLVPKSEGGADDETNLLTLCYECHGKIHGMVRKDISKLTKEGIARARAAGKPRKPNIHLHRASKLGAEAQKKAKEMFHSSLKPVVLEIQAQGITTIRAVCDELNRRNITSRYGGPWQLGSTHRLLTDIKKRERLSSL